MGLIAISGNFDPLHVGHLRHIKDAISRGDKLVVILSTDRQCIKKKGICVLPYNERKELIEGYLRFGDEVVPNIDSDLTCARSLEYYKPNILCKGGDRNSLESMPENEIKLCQELSIEIVFSSGGDKVQSSSSIINKIAEKTRDNLKYKYKDVVSCTFKKYTKGIEFLSIYDVDNLKDALEREIDFL